MNTEHEKGDQDMATDPKLALETLANLQYVQKAREYLEQMKKQANYEQEIVDLTETILNKIKTEPSFAKQVVEELEKTQQVKQQAEAPQQQPPLQKQPTTPTGKPQVRIGGFSIQPGLGEAYADYLNSKAKSKPDQG